MRRCLQQRPEVKPVLQRLVAWMVSEKSGALVWYLALTVRSVASSLLHSCNLTQALPGRKGESDRDLSSRGFCILHSHGLQPHPSSPTDLVGLGSDLELPDSASRVHSLRRVLHKALSSADVSTVSTLTLHVSRWLDRYGKRRTKFSRMRAQAPFFSKTYFESFKY